MPCPPLTNRIDLRFLFIQPNLSHPSHLPLSSNNYTDDNTPIPRVDLEMGPRSLWHFDGIRRDVPNYDRHGRMHRPNRPAQGRNRSRIHNSVNVVAQYQPTKRPSAAKGRPESVHRAFLSKGQSRNNTQQPFRLLQTFILLPNLPRDLSPWRSYSNWKQKLLQE